MEYEDLKRLAIDLEHYETDEWAIDRILEKEIFNLFVLDPCAGNGIMTKKALEKGYSVFPTDIHDWGFNLYKVQDFLKMKEKPFFENDFTVFMNPPFSLATQFVEKAFELGARKIVMFQRWAFRESQSRREFFEKYPLARLYLCGDRAVCWRHDLPTNEKGKRYDPKTGKILGSAPTAHGFFIWERGQEQSNPPTFMLYK